MKESLDHLPERQQRELERIKTILLEEFDRAIHSGGGASESWRRDGKVLKIILFGSYSRDDWVDAPETGYQSDFDILVIVSHPKLTETARYWHIAEDRIARDPTIGRIVNIIVHTMAEVNQGLSQGQYFWTDILRDGIAVFAIPGHSFAQPKPISPQEAVAIAKGYFVAKASLSDGFVAAAQFHYSRDERRLAAFNLHQAVEAAYAALLLVRSFYFPRSHNIKFLRSQAETLERSLIAAWPRDTRADRRRFDLLKRAYVEARYADNYDMSDGDFSLLLTSIKTLRNLIDRSCISRISQLYD